MYRDKPQSQVSTQS